MTKKRKIILIIIIVLLVFGAVLGFLYWKNSKSNNTNKTNVKTVDTIDGYGYTLKENDSKLKKEKFNELKSILKEDDIDYEAYAMKLAEIFVIDVYDLSSKLNKYDVGGLDYVLEEKKDMLKLKLQDTLYNNMVDNVDKKRTQKLPTVTAADASELEESSYNYNKVDYEGYSVKVAIDYKEDMGYDNNVFVQMIKNDNKLFVVVIKPN